MRPTVAHRLQFLDPSAPLAGQAKRLGKLVPVLVQYSQQGGEIQLSQGREITLPHHALLWNAQTSFNVSSPPILAKRGQMRRQEIGKLHGGSLNQIIHTVRHVQVTG